MSKQNSTEPDRFFLSRKYALGYIALSASSSEEDIIGNAVIEGLEKLDVETSEMLDVGSADGRLTRKIGSQFERRTIFEPNPYLFSLACSNLRGLSKDDIYFKSVFNKSLVETRYYSFLLASHVLYHLPVTGWTDFFSQCRKILTPDGALAVILWNTSSEARRITMETSPDRWICSSAQLFEMETELKQIGLEVVLVKELCPTILASSSEMSGLIVDFLLGQQQHSSNVNCAKELEALIAKGINNSQDLIFLKPSHHD